MNNFFDWDTAIFVTVLAGYILAGVFVGQWMDEKFYDPNRVRKDVGWREVLRVLLWIFYLPMVALLVRMGVKYRHAPKSEYKLPKSEPYTGYRAETFTHLPNLTQVDIAPDNPVYEVRGGHIVEKATGKLVATTATNTLVPDGVTEIGEEAFCCRDDVEVIVIPDTVTKIGVSAFQGCQNLTKVVIPESVKEICDCAFWECPSLAELHLPASLKKLGDAFDGSCYDGMDLYCHMPEPIPYGLESDEGYPPNTHDRLFVPKGAREKYEAAEPWNYYETIKEFGS